MTHFTLWLLLVCIPSNVGCVSLLHTRPVLRPMGTYASFADCKQAVKDFEKEMRIKGVAPADPFCIPTGLTDPLRARSTVR